MTQQAINIADALERLDASTVRERTEAINDLRHCLKHNRSAAQKETINEQSFHHLFETIFGLVSSDRAQWAKATKSGPRATLARRLDAYADALRLAVEYGLQRLLVRNTKAILNHIVQSLPMSNGGYCEPLLMPYLKCMQVIVEYQPHVEHLPAADWLAVVTFCNGTLQLLRDDEAGETSASNSAMSVRSRNASLNEASRAGTVEPQTKSSRANLSSSAVQELILCLRQLLLAPNAPVFPVAAPCLDVLATFLQTHKRAGRAHQDAFAALNSVLMRMSYDNTKLAINVIQQLLPVVKDLWSTRTAVSLKDEMLAFLIITQYHLAAMIASEEYEDQTRRDVGGLIEIISIEYGRRTAQSQLQLSDMRLQPAAHPADDCVLKCPTFSLSQSSPNVNAWTTVLCVGRLILLLESSPSSHSADSQAEPPAKRTKRPSTSQSLLRELQDPQPTAKVCALKVLSVIIPHVIIPSDTYLELIERLVTCVSDKNITVSNWAMLCLAASTNNARANLAQASQHWLTVWHLAVRNIMSSAACRPACLTMRVLLERKLVAFLDISDSIESIFASVDLSGPSLVSDSSLDFFVAVVSMLTIQNPSRLPYATDRVLHWLFAKWEPGSVTHKAPAQNIHTAMACDILRLLGTCIDKSLYSVAAATRSLSGIVGLAAWFSYRNKDTAEYLLLLESRTPVEPITTRRQWQRQKPADSGQPALLETQILGRLLTNVERALQELNETVVERPSNVTNLVISKLTVLCVVASVLGNHPTISASERQTNLHKQTNDLIKALADYCSSADENESKFEAIANNAACSFPPLHSLTTLQDDPFDAAGLSMLALHVTRAFDVSKQKQASSSQHYDDFDDMMDIQPTAESQRSREVDNTQTYGTPRSAAASRSDTAASKSSNLTYLRFVACVYESVSMNQTLNHVPETFVDYMVAQEPAAFVLNHAFLEDLFASPLRLRVEDVENLLDYLGATFLSSYEFNHSETVHCICLDAMRHTLEVWINPENDESYKIGADMYEWIVKVLLDQVDNKIGFASPQTDISASDLFRSLMVLKPDYAQDFDQLPSARTSLLRLLGNSDMVVRFHIAQDLPEIFDHYVLARHDDIFLDIFESLPTDQDWLEGLALRLLTLWRLGSRWHTLLRNSVYYIFETAGMCSPSAGYATRCIRHLVDALQISSPPALFMMFAPQLLYTWFDRDASNSARAFKAIPYTVFGYKSLKDLFRDCIDEAFGQAVMRGTSDDIEALTRIAGLDAKSALEKSIARAIAYTISVDTDNHSAKDKDRSSTNQERALSDMLGADRYTHLVKMTFPRVLGIFFITLGDVQDAHKVKPHVQFYAEAKDLLEGIRKDTYLMNDTEDILPPDQQPSFTVRTLFHRVDRLCRRANYSVEKAWTPAVFTFVLRMLLGQIVPSLGSLHACSVVRKIRLLICVAGPVALKGYPLQMALHGLQPLLTDMQCAKETIGIVQYLVREGADSLGEAFSFTAGVGLTVLMSIRAFLRSSQESTTQETFFKNTMNTASKFHYWFARYLKEYVAKCVNRQDTAMKPRSVDIKTFQTLMQAASTSRAEGNSIRGTDESVVLLQLLQIDQRAVRDNSQLLSRSARQLAFKLLCQDFQGAESFEDDILGADAEAQRYVREIWRSSQHRGVGDGYKLWVAKTLGRAFASGANMRFFERNGRRFGTSHEVNGGSPTVTTQDNIVKSLSKLLFSDRRMEAGLAESVLRLIYQRLPSKERPGFADIVQPHICQALALDSSPEFEGFQSLPEQKLLDAASPDHDVGFVAWMKGFVVALSQCGADDAVLGALPNIVDQVDDLAEQVFPYVLHVVLQQHFDRQRQVRDTLSEAFDKWTSKPFNQHHVPHLRALLNALQYLRTQPVPREKTRNERDFWLDLNHLDIVKVATRCGMFKLALLMLESYTGQPVESSRRSSVSLAEVTIPNNVQLSVYKNLDEPDSFYGVQQQPGVSALLERLEYESNGAKTLLLRGARMDSSVRNHREIDAEDSRGLLNSVAMLNLNAVTQQLLGNGTVGNSGSGITSSLLDTARKLEKWDIKAPETLETSEGIIYRAFQGISNAVDAVQARRHVNTGLTQAFTLLTRSVDHPATRESMIRTLATLSETDEVLSTSKSIPFADVAQRLEAREAWMLHANVEDVKPILSSRETIFGILNRNDRLREQLKVSPVASLSAEIAALRTSSTLLRRHGALQDALTSAIYLVDIAKTGSAVGVEFDGSATCALAMVLWDQHESDTAIQLLQKVRTSRELKRDMSLVDVTQMFLILGRYTAEAQTEEAQEIINNYLKPALKELKADNTGQTAGEVFHAYATFCDTQLRKAYLSEELTRLKESTVRKQAEIDDFKEEYKHLKDKTEKDRLRRDLSKTMKWKEADAHELKRLEASRDNFVRDSLKHYLLALRACDSYDSDVLRVFGLWLEYYDSDAAVEAMKEWLEKVPSGKFALLMNQLSSRLQSEESNSQRLLTNLVYRICCDHPYHGMHQMYALGATSDSRDAAADSRIKAAKSIISKLSANSRAKHYWKAIHDSNALYHELSMVKEELKKFSRDVTLDQLKAGRRVQEKTPGLKVPPATYPVELKASRNYDDLPVIIGWSSRVSIAGGLSAPKIATAKASNGKLYKQLFKSGNDDLRQDAIMEQVFEQASKLLRNHTTTRSRNLHIRNYKVVPLSGKTGLMEFVSNTIPFGEVLKPAHRKYYPKDWKEDDCRHKVAGVGKSSNEERIKTYKQVTEHFHPVLRFFFLERFEDPDEWFEKRLAYTRTTAAISMLGHVLGLGDRHLHNILLDEKTGEVVHIDLGVAFDAGRILPCPEVVPFRLTRDVVDGMGYTKTEGVFRRCCEFTLDALRKEKEGIMILLNVLRYDPLVNWTVSAGKARRMQDQPADTDTGENTKKEGGLNDDDGNFEERVDYQSIKSKDNNAGEAGRALAVVEQKLSANQSIKASVSGLIRQASDERNLALLFNGWAAYC